MSQNFQPCCERVLLVLTEAPRTEGANPSPEVLRCASCGSTVPAKAMANVKSGGAGKLARALTEKIGLRRKQAPRKSEMKIKHWL